MLWTETSLSCTCLSNDSASDHDGHAHHTSSGVMCGRSSPASSYDRLDPTGFTLKPNKQSRLLSPVCSHAGLLLFVLGMSINIHSDHILRNLRKPGETVYRIPHGMAAPGPPLAEKHHSTSWTSLLELLSLLTSFGNLPFSPRRNVPLCVWSKLLWGDCGVVRLRCSCLVFTLLRLRLLHHLLHRTQSLSSPQVPL